MSGTVPGTKMDPYQTVSVSVYTAHHTLESYPFRRGVAWVHFFLVTPGYRARQVGSRALGW